MICNNEMISIIVPVFNIESYIEECVNSILKQTYQNLEIILVDDGSQDNSGLICDSFCEIDNRIRVLHKKNGGLSSARNYGIEQAQGEYLLFVDGDDRVENNLCERLLGLLQANKADVSVCCSYSNQMYTPAFVINTYAPKDALKEMFLERSYNVSAWGKLYKREIFSAIRFPEGLLFEDLATTYKALHRAQSIVVTTERLYYYRIREGSIMQSDFQKRKQDLYSVSMEVEKFMKENYPENVNVIRKRNVRYFVSQFREIALSAGDWSEYETKLREYIKKHIVSYIFSTYKLSSKVFAVCLIMHSENAKKIYRFIMKGKCHEKSFNLF